jgi:hypothetical protein
VRKDGQTIREEVVTVERGGKRLVRVSHLVSLTRMQAAAPTPFALLGHAGRAEQEAVTNMRSAGRMAASSQLSGENGSRSLKLR